MPLENARTRHQWLAIWRAVIFAAPLLLYTLTLHGDVEPADSGELQIVAFTFGVAHPPGYPLFSLLAGAFMHAPLGSPYARTAFLSALASALAVALIGSAAQRVLERRGTAWVGSLLGGTLAASMLAFSTTFWAQATTTNIRSLTAFFTALFVWISARAETRPEAHLWMWLALALGLGIAHHPSLVFSGAVIAALVLLRLLRAKCAHPRALLSAVGMLLLTQLVWLYLPLRDAAGAPFAPGSLGTLEGLLDHMLARGFAGDMFAFANREALPERLTLVPSLMRFQFGAELRWAVLLGVLLTSLHLPALGIAWTLALLVHGFVTLTYRAPQTVEYALPAWVLLSAMMGTGWAALLSARRAWARWMGWIGCGLMLVWVWGEGLSRLPAFLDLADDRSVHQNAEAVLRAAPQASTILAQWHEATPLWALQSIEQVRPDVRVEYVPPRGAQSYAETFAERAAALAPERPTFVTSFFEDAFARAALFSRPLPHVPSWQVSTQPFSTTPGLVLRFGDRWEVRALLSTRSPRAEHGAVIFVDVSWRALAPSASADDALTVRILRPDGRLATNADTRLTPVHEGFAAKRLVLGVPLDLPPGRYTVLAGVYRQTEQGFAAHLSAAGREYEPIGAIEVVPRRTPPITQRALELSLGPEAPTLIGVDYDTGLEGRLRLWTHWRLSTQARAITLRDARGQPIAATQQVPAAPTSEAATFASLPFDLAPTTEELWLEGRRLPRFWDGERYIAFGDQLVLFGSRAQRTDEQLTLSLEWAAAQNLTRDYIVSVRAAGEGFYRTHDGVPALGALPTLKWIRGARVSDPHPIPLDGYRGALRCSVVVYESNTRFVLPPLDERYEGMVYLPC